ncbi:type IV pilus biogenesis protein PilP (plasmid) [Thioalkalivibrio sp. K90mix]|nr:type IV pilus biogenesis protein PilP [Thioalkalivibrio sp. K90mix]
MRRNVIAAAVAAFCLGTASVAVVNADNEDMPAFMQEMEDPSDDSGSATTGSEASSQASDHVGSEAVENDGVESPPDFMEDMDEVEEPTGTSGESEAIKDPSDTEGAGDVGGASGQEVMATEDGDADRVGDSDALEDESSQPVPDPQPIIAGDMQKYSPGVMTPDERAYLEELRSLQRQQELWQARNEMLAMQQQHVEMTQEMRKLQMPEPSEAAAQQAEREAEERQRDERDLRQMMLVSVFGGQSDPRAELFFAGGRMQVSKGDVLPGGWTVRDIELTRVLVEKDRREFEIGMGSPSTTQGQVEAVPGAPQLQGNPEGAGSGQTSAQGIFGR